MVMNPKIADIVERARGLSPVEMAELIDALLAALDAPDPAIQRAWAEEAESRLDAIERGDMPVRDADEITYDSLIR